jgi:hypothetical protein
MLSAILLVIIAIFRTHPSLSPKKLPDVSTATDHFLFLPLQSHQWQSSSSPAAAPTC